MSGQQKNNQNGFTIIEVVLVLAIAALIFLMVFIALPALQSGQRDTQRKGDLGRINSAMVKYSTSNNGKVPQNAADLTSGDGFVDVYLEGDAATPNTAGEAYADPQFGPYVLSYQAGPIATSDTAPTIGTVYYDASATCGPNGSTVNSTNKRDYALLMRLEGQQVPFCLDSSS